MIRRRSAIIQRCIVSRGPIWLSAYVIRFRALLHLGFLGFEHSAGVSGYFSHLSCPFGGSSRYVCCRVLSVHGVAVTLIELWCLWLLRFFARFAARLRRLLGCIARLRRLITRFVARLRRLVTRFVAPLRRLVTRWSRIDLRRGHCGNYFTAIILRYSTNGPLWLVLCEC